MKKLVFLTILVLAAPALLAQDWRDRPYQRLRDSSFELTPFAGYRWGGTIYSDQTSLYGQDVDLQSSGHYGLAFGIPVNPYGMKVELMVNRQNTQVGTQGGLFVPGGSAGDFNITYYQAGVLFPFNESRAATPFAVVSAGIANLDPATTGVATANKFAASAGVGVKVPFSQNLALRAEIRGYYTAMGGNGDNCYRCYDYTYNRDLYQGEANIGLAFRF